MRPRPPGRKCGSRLVRRRLVLDRLAVLAPAEAPEPPAILVRDRQVILGAASWRGGPPGRAGRPRESTAGTPARDLLEPAGREHEQRSRRPQRPRRAGSGRFGSGRNPSGVRTSSPQNRSPAAIAGSRSPRTITSSPERPPSARRAPRSAPSRPSRAAPRPDTAARSPAAPESRAPGSAAPGSASPPPARPRGPAPA